MMLHHYPELFLFGLYPEKYNYLEMWRNINELQFFKWQKTNSVVLELKKKLNKKWYRQENEKWTWQNRIYIEDIWKHLETLLELS